MAGERWSGTPLHHLAATLTQLPLVLAAVLSLWTLTVAGCTDDDEPTTVPNPQAVLELESQLPLPSAATDVAVMDEFAFVAAGQAGLCAVDMHDPANPIMVKMLDTLAYAGSIDLVRTAANQSRLDVALVLVPTEGIETFDITDPPNAYSFQLGVTVADGRSLFIQAPESPEEPYVVFVADGWSGIRTFKSDPRSPGVLRYDGVFARTQGRAMDLVVRDDYAYVADDEMGLAVFDVHDLTLGQVELVSWADTPGNAVAVALDGNYAYVADGPRGMAILEVDGPAEPDLVARIDLQGTCVDVEVDRGYAILAADTAGIHVVDVSDPERPEGLETVPSSAASGVCVTSTGLVFVTDKEDGLLILRFSETPS